MKKVILFILLGFIYFEGESQLTDAQLITQADSIKNATTAGFNTANRVGRMFENIIYNKINNSKLIDSTKIPYLAKNNNFTGSVDTFKNIVISNNYGIDSNGNASLNDISLYGSIYANGGSFNTISNDGTLSSNSATILPTQQAVKTYVDAHSLPYKVISGYISSSDSNTFSITMLSNPYSATFSIGKVAVGTLGLSSSVSSFTNSYFILSPIQYYDGSTYTFYDSKTSFTSASNAYIQIYNRAGFKITQNFQNIYFEIKVYP